MAAKLVRLNVSKRAVWMCVSLVGASLLVAAGGCGDSETIAPTTTTGGAGGTTTTGGSGGVGGEGDGGGGMGGMPGADFAEPCTTNDQCEPGFCIPEMTTGWPLGYCTELCNDLAPCATPGTQCVDIGSGQFCLRDCIPSQGGSECEAHQQCFDLGNGAGVCGPGCSSDDQCPVLGKCSESGFCTEPENCTDGIDNDGDELADCEDDDCAAGCMAPINTACAAATAAMASQSGDTTGGTTLFAGSCTGSAGALEDIFSYTAPADGLASLQLASGTDQGIYVRTTCNDAASEVACIDAALGGDLENLYFPVTNGTAFTVFVDGYLSPLEAGPYGLDIALIPYNAEVEDNGTFATANAHVIGAAFNAAITMGDDDFVAVSVPGPASTLTATVVGGGANSCDPAGGIDSELQILGTDGSTELAFNDDISGFGNFCSAATVTDLAAGTYYIRISSSEMFCPDCAFDYNVLIDLQ